MPPDLIRAELAHLHADLAVEPAIRYSSRGCGVTGMVAAGSRRLRGSVTASGYGSAMTPSGDRAMTEQILIAALAVCVGAAAGVLVGQWLQRRPPDEAEAPDATETLQALNAQLHAELTARLEVQAAELRRIADASGQRDRASEHLRGLDATRQVLEVLHARDEERRASDAENREVVRRLATVLAGGNTKEGRGARPARAPRAAPAVDAHLGLPRERQGRGVRPASAGRSAAPDRLRWTAVAELEAMEAEEDPTRRDACARKVERAVASRAKDVAQYIDTSVTSPVAVAAVPDAAYQVLSRAHAEAFMRVS